MPGAIDDEKEGMINLNRVLWSDRNLVTTKRAELDWQSDAAKDVTGMLAV